MPQAAALSRNTLAWVLMASTLVVLTLIAYWPALRRGGFVVDDWAAASRVLDPSPGQNAWGATLDVAGSRLAQVPYLVGTFELFGAHARAHVWLAVAIGIAGALVLFALLRKYRVPDLLAGGVAALAFVLPAGAAAKVWPAVAPEGIALLAFALGLLVALSAFERASLARHAVSLALYAVAVFSKELTLVPLALSVLWYLPFAPRRAAVRRWIADLVVAGAAVVAALWIPAPAQARTAADTWFDHARALAVASLHTVWDTLTLYAVGRPPTALLSVILAAVAVGAFLLLRPLWGEAGAALVPVGALFVVLAYAVYVPANAALLPDLPGPLGRPGIAGGPAFAAVLVGIAAAVAAAIVRLAGKRWLAPLTAAAIGVVVLGAALQTRDEASAWADAATRERHVVQAAEHAVPDPPRRTTFILAATPPDVTVSRGDAREPITVFLEPFVSAAALRVQYDRNDLYGVALRRGDRTICGAETLVLVRPGYPYPVISESEGGADQSLYGLDPKFHTRGSIYNTPSGRFDRLREVDVPEGRARTIGVGPAAP